MTKNKQCNCGCITGQVAKLKQSQNAEEYKEEVYKRGMILIGTTLELIINEAKEEARREVLDEIIRTLEVMPIKVVGDSAKTLHQVTNIIMSKRNQL